MPQFCPFVSWNHSIRASGSHFENRAPDLQQRQFESRMDWNQVARQTIWPTFLRSGKVLCINRRIRLFKDGREFDSPRSEGTFILSYFKASKIRA